MTKVSMHDHMVLARASLSGVCFTNSKGSLGLIILIISGLLQLLLISVP